MKTVIKSLNSTFLNKATFCQSKQEYNPLILSGVSGAGKGTLFGMLYYRNPALFELSVSCTTRYPRPGEEHEKHYFFITHEEFKNEIQKGSFVEYCYVHNNYYGTLTSEVFKKGKICVLDIDVQGAEKIQSRFPQWNYVFINLFSREVQEQRLRGRGTETEQQIQVRLANSVIEIAHKNMLGFYYDIVNDIREQAYADLTYYLRSKYPGVHIN